MRWLWLVLALCVVVPAHAGKKKKKQATAVDVPCGWAVGDTVAFEVRTTRTREDARGPYTPGVDTSLYTLTAVSVDDRGTVFRVPGTSEIHSWPPGTPPELVPIFEKLVAAMGEVVPEVLVTPDGQLVEVVNVDTMLPAYEALISGMVEAMLADAEPEMATGVRSMMAAFTGPAVFASQILEPLYPLFTFSCAHLEVGAPVVAPTAYPNPLDGSDITATVEFRADAVQADTADLVMTLTPDVDVLTALVRKHVEAQFVAADLPFPPEFEVPPMDVHTTFRVTVGLGDGWPVSGETDAVMTMVGGSRVTHRDYRRVDPPSR